MSRSDRARVAIDASRCEGCRRCLDSCPTDVFTFDEERERALVTYPTDCCACLLCLQDCPTDAIWVDVHLSKGAFLSVYDQIRDDTGQLSYPRS
jgi:NAD-dependent dihydropyrimidine dehydrogenase PreA subunit